MTGPSAFITFSSKVASVTTTGALILILLVIPSESTLKAGQTMRMGASGTLAALTTDALSARTARPQPAA
jgi:hypothetical protein